MAPRIVGTRIEALHRLPSSQRFFLLPGQFYVTSRPMIVSTVLGSCVAVCLYDPVAHVAGMNHFLLAGEGPADHLPLGLSEVGRYGIEAMELLINALLRLGGQKGRFEAKVFGGAHVLPQGIHRTTLAVGEANGRFVRRFLADERIPLVAESLGGTRGRVIHFHTDTHFVWSRLIRNQAVAAQVAKEELVVLHRLRKKSPGGTTTLF